MEEELKGKTVLVTGGTGSIGSEIVKQILGYGIDKVIKMRRDKAEYMTKKLSRIKEITLPTAPPDYFHVYQMYTIRIDGTRQIRDRLIQYLGDKGISTKVYFEPVHLSYFYKNKFGFKRGDLPVTERLSDQVLTFHTHPLLKNEEIDYISEEIDKFFSEAI
ncbi:MAG: hypothetical protein DRQ02_07455 [Candidatus Latescibacterota bacterium]|nr:MAG: hypothetical protein DRQ02_07455 [Candidatus Latescibacterota bacterium]